MDDKLLGYYERELTFIREMGAEFARKYPKIAGRLQLEPDRCEDPHTERLIEAFAFLSSRIHKKIDDDFPEITESLFSIIYPHYLNPVPSMSVVMFDPLGQNVPAAGYPIEEGTALYSKPIGGTPCQFKTTYPVTLWPIEVTSASLRDPKELVPSAQQAIVIQLKTVNKQNFSELNWNTARFFLNGPAHHVFHLYELVFNHVCHMECVSITAQGMTARTTLRPDHISPVGFERDEGMMPFPTRSFPGYRLLLEYFCFPEKFLFIDISGLEKLRDAGFNDTLDLWIYLDRTAKSDLVINKDTFCLNATPAINLFKRIAEPIRVEHRKAEYQVIPDIRRQMATEVFSIDRVTASSLNTPGLHTDFRPFYSIRHHLDGGERDGRRAFWHIQRRPSGKKDDSGTEIFLSFADLNFRSVDPDVEVLTVHTTCTNRDLPARLPFGDPNGDFTMEKAAPVERINCLIKPTPVRRPSLGGALQWRLISHFSLNYLSIVEGGEMALKEILNLYDFDNSAATRQQINSIVSLQHRHVTKRIKRSFCRGTQVTITFDEDKLVGAGLYLFACVLERFLGQYVSVNSFSQLVLNTIQKKEAIRQWPPRSGHRVLL